MFFPLLLGAALACAQGPATAVDPSASEPSRPELVGLPAWVKEIGSPPGEPANANPTTVLTNFNNLADEPPAPTQVQVSVGLTLPETKPTETKPPEAPKRRALPSPWQAPPFPSSEYQGFPLIGVPPDTTRWPLMKILQGTGTTNSILSRNRCLVSGGLEAGFDEHLTKPTRFDTLQRVLAERAGAAMV